MADSVADKARKARNRANDENWGRGASYKTEDLVMDLTRGKKSKIEKVVGRSADVSERKAADVMQQRRRVDTGKTAARANFIEKRTVKKAAEAKVRAGVGGGTPKKQTPKASAVAKAAKVVKKAMVDPTSAVSKTAKSKASKQLTGDKAAEAMRKRTSPRGVRKYEKGASKAIDKKYPGLYKKSKGMK